MFSISRKSFLKREHASVKKSFKLASKVKNIEFGNYVSYWFFIFRFEPNNVPGSTVSKQSISKLNVFMMQTCCREVSCFRILKIFNNAQNRYQVVSLENNSQFLEKNASKQPKIVKKVHFSNF